MQLLDENIYLGLNDKLPVDQTYVQKCKVLTI